MGSQREHERAHARTRTPAKVEKIPPRHRIELTEEELTEILEGFLVALHEYGHERDSATLYKPPPAAFITGQVGADLAHRLAQLPDLHPELGERTTEKLTPAGLDRLKHRIREQTLIDRSRPHADELRAALREEEVAEAHFTLSIWEGKPGPERDAAIARRNEAWARVDKAALLYAGYTQEDIEGGTSWARTSR